MSKVSPLPASRLRALYPADRIPWDGSDAIPRNHASRRAPQPRALGALELALNIDNAGYNVYLSGSPSLGRGYMLREFLEPRAKKAPTPPDLLYVNNFEEPDQPRLLAVPAGQGKKLKTAVGAALATVRRELPVRLEHGATVKRRGEIQDKFQSVRSRLLREMDKTAGGHGFNLDVDEQGALTLYPLVEGKRLSEEDFERLDASVRESLKQRGDVLLRAMTGMVRKLSHAEQEFRAAEQVLDREVVSAVLDAVLTPVVEKILKACGNDAALAAYFTELRDDILDHSELFLPREAGPASGGGYDGPPPEDPYRYEINLFVDNSQTRGAPLISEDHPTFGNLLGCIERESEMGALVTDFTLIKAGALHRANGGFLVLHVDDVLHYPAAWEGLLRSLRAGHGNIYVSYYCHV